jgi:hypothetical protein
VTTELLERPAKPCGCGPTASTGPSVLGQRVHIMEGITNAGGGSQRVHVAEGVGNWAVGRVSQTVHIRPVTECDCGITDAPNRVEPFALGVADVGVEWLEVQSNIGASPGLDWATSAEAGYLRFWTEGPTLAEPNGKDIRARLMALGIPQTFRMTFDVRFPSFDTVTESASIEFSVRDPADGFSNTYFAELAIFFGDGLYLSSQGVAGSAHIAFGFTPGSDYHVRWEQDANDEQRVKVWQGDTEPGTWTLTQDVSTQDDWDQGAEFRIDVDQISGPGDDSTPDLEMHLWNLDIEGIHRCMFDNFNRNEASDWGISTPTGVAYTYPSGSGTVTLAVANGVGIADMASSTSKQVRIPAHDLWTQDDGFVGSYDFRTQATVETSGGDRLQLHIFHEPAAPADCEVFLVVANDPSYGMFAVYSNPGDDELVKTDWLDDTWYRVKFEYRPGVVLRAKVWPRADEEPENWDVSTSSVSSDPLSGYLEFGIANTNEPGAYEFDNFTFNTCPAEEE